MMSSMVSSQKEFSSALRDLLELDYDAVEAYKTSIDRIRDPESKDLITEYMHDHERHIQEITDVFRKHNLDCPTGPTKKQWLTKGKVVISNIIGDDGVLSAMSSNEEETCKAYESIVNRDDKWEDCKEMLNRGLQDERNHKKGIEERRKFLKEQH
ncbi:hypothetical protein DICPUDRAFT_34705 [Dictyostelium purpureum]|uniref:DUF2383 domain-containing protein n=1 Tax=Dictyostelium purpureum TaxID=5786 RepID=F0ZN43_DICPU|nr:uncharacterized protein DICPUDRAFT_34705 [Dictyostelium purpureum]EGC34631.1 hypothetical protein DICPUDRAFT_34705 [Dictyostelium purpureum]|eukprot:XP_003288856.1 hypothetical protein DICPUDRAFT_34705 [Dictyostelium purpureum]